MNPEHFEEFVLGHMVEATMPLAESIKRRDRKIKPLAEPEKLFANTFSKAIASFNKDMEIKIKSERELIAQFKVNQ